MPARRTYRGLTDEQKKSIEKLYTEDNLTIREIASQVGCKYHQVSNYLHSHVPPKRKIRTGTDRLSPEQSAQIIELCRQGKKNPEITEIVSCTVEQVKALVFRSGGRKVLLAAEARPAPSAPTATDVDNAVKVLRVTQQTALQLAKTLASYAQNIEKLIEPAERAAITLAATEDTERVRADDADLARRVRKVLQMIESAPVIAPADGEKRRRETPTCPEKDPVFQEAVRQAEEAVRAGLERRY